MDFTEIGNLAIALSKMSILYTINTIFDGYQIRTDDWDVVIHSGSYGHEEGLLEGMGKPFTTEDDDVIGYLTAKDVLRLIAEAEKN